MTLIPRLTGSNIEQHSTPVAAPSARPAHEPRARQSEPARYDGSPPLAAWTWSWAQSGGSLVDLAQALQTAQRITASPAAHTGVDAQRTLALLSG